MPARAARTTALAAAAALITGVLVGLAAPAQAAAGATVQPNSSDWVDSNGTRHIVGEVTNTGDVPIAAPHIDLEIQDASGATVESTFADASVAALAPGESSPFEAQTSVASYSGFRVAAVSAVPVGFTPNHFLTACVTQVFRDGSGNRQLGGTVRNDNLTAAADPTVVFTFYDGAGKVVGLDTASTDSGAPIAAGGSASFTEVVNDEAPAYTRYTMLASSSDPADPGPSAGTGCSSSPPAEQSLDCNPRMTLSSKAIVTGQGVTVSLSGTPRSFVTLEGYSRPSTDYAAIRRDVQLDDGGQAASFVVRPSTAARVRLQVRGCSQPGAGQVITVTPVLTITASRVSAFTYLFAGKINPAAANTGRLVNLYYQGSTGGPVRKGTARTLKDGRYSVKLSFPPGPKQTLRFFWGTGADMTNSAATSAVRSLLVY